MSNRERSKQLASELANRLSRLTRVLPKSSREWWQVLKDPKHPFTLSLLTTVVLLVLKASGFSVFLAVTWILGNLILTPLGLVLIPVVILIVVIFHRHFNRDKLSKLKMKLTEPEHKRDTGKMSQADFEMAKDALLTEYLE